MCRRAASLFIRSPCRSPPVPAPFRSPFPSAPAGPPAFIRRCSSSSSRRWPPPCLLSLTIYVFYRNSARLADLIGVTGTTIVVRLSAFLLFCIGIQVAWNGLAELLGTVVLNTVS